MESNMERKANIMNLRYERKFRIKNQISLSRLIYIIKLNTFNFKIHYPRRRINNIYLDNHNYQNYTDNQVGISDRTKYRLRWYGNDIMQNNNLKFEKKNKFGWVGSKKTYDCEPFNFDKKKSVYNYFKNLMNELSINESLDIKNNFPVIMNAYTRIYFISRCERFRVTLDYKQEYFSIRRLGMRPIKKIFSDKNDFVLELKYDIKYDDTASEVSNQFPFLISKNSKYINGIDYLKEQF